MASTRTRWRTFRSIPRVSRVSSRSTERPILPRPSARRVPRWRAVWPIWLRVCVTLSFAIASAGGRDRTLLRRRFLSSDLGVGGNGLVAPCAGRQDVGDRLPSDPRDLVGPAEPLETVDGRLQHVDRGRRPKALREDVADPGELENGADAAPGDDAGSLARRPEKHAGRVEFADHLVRDRRPVLRYLEEVLLRVVDRLRDGKRDLARLAVADADAVDLVADHDERREREAPAALDDLRDAVDLDHALFQIARLSHVDGHQKRRPPSRTASASALTRPWYRYPPRSKTTVSIPALFAAAA